MALEGPISFGDFAAVRQSWRERCVAAAVWGRPMHPKASQGTFWAHKKLRHVKTDRNHDTWAGSDWNQIDEG